MFITISIQSREETTKELTIMVDSRQQICNTIKELKREKLTLTRIPGYIRSWRKKTRISTEKTYEEAEIYNGDILIIE